MSTIHFHQQTTATPEHFIAGLTDFGPGRERVFGKSADDYLKVYDQRPGHADVKEGSGGVWERLNYDWTDPHHIVLKTTDSNTWGAASGYTYTLTETPNGATDIDVVIVRDGKNVKGKALGLVLGTVGKGVLVKAFDHAVKTIEASDYPATPLDPPARPAQPPEQ
jgi:hypothetical protein